MNYKSLKHTASEAFIYEQLRKLKPGKAVGLNKIPARLIKGSAAEIAKPPTKWIHGQIPNDWKLARMIPAIGVRGGGAGGGGGRPPPPIFRDQGKSGNLCLKSRAI